MRHHRLPVDDISHFLLLIRAHGRNDIEDSRVDLPTTVADDANHHLLPAVITPSLAAIVLTQIGQCSSRRPCLIVLTRPSSSLYMVMTMNSSVRRGWVIVDPTEVETSFLVTVWVFSHRITQVGPLALALVFDGLELE